MFLTRIIDFLFKRAKYESNSVVVENHMFEHFAIDIDECEFLTNTEFSTEDNTDSPTAGFWKSFDTEQAIERSVTQIVIEREVYDTKYKFISHPINMEPQCKYP
jgi:hypothetical protein